MTVIDAFCKCLVASIILAYYNVIYCAVANKITLKISSINHTITSTLVHQGVLPCYPISPVVGMTGTEALELYCVAHLRGPHLSIQAFMKTMSNLHRVCFLTHSLPSQPNHSDRTHLTGALNMLVLYVLIHVLTNEVQLTFRMLYAMDGNDSLKRVLQQSLDGDNSLSVSPELPTDQLLTSNHHLSHNFVDQFMQDSVFATGDKVNNLESCKGQWKNVDDVKTRKAWGIYDKTRVFIAVCCHGVCLLITDMVAKYPLADVTKFLNVFSNNLGGGSLRPLMHLLHHTCLVGAFYGHAHRCLIHQRSQNQGLGDM
ncbi:uncharacterized protein EDB91DRAFT_1050458 [Suillus paluster]|uniref:uncharacterized protein n=1 Tax=Suillus paluster TaxID=48578 RepID=UPI001B876EA3|nr:uncharacterized protein EDB91DRAFT_1050458 [Suillus paluster]KAG1744664.1 hypothetical protein EDB91DRAFT_1050458 [Suillus paluster]